MRGRVAAVTLLLASCASGTPTPRQEAPAEADRAATETRRADIVACFEAMEAGTSPTNEAVAQIVDACKKLWLDEGCRAAWTRAIDAPPESRAEGVIRGCAASICPNTSDPKPTLCTHDLAAVDLLADDPDWGELWKEFNEAVLVEDLGLPEGDTRGAILSMRLLQLVAISKPPPREPSDDL